MIHKRTPGEKSAYLDGLKSALEIIKRQGPNAEKVLEGAIRILEMEVGTMESPQKGPQCICLHDLTDVRGHDPDCPWDK